MRFNDIIGLNEEAKNLLIKLLGSQIIDKGNVATKLIVRDDYIEYYFIDGTLLEMAVVRDFNDNMNPSHVVLNEYVKTQGSVPAYNCLYTERFKVF
jgi:hypothetical protein